MEWGPEPEPAMDLEIPWWIKQSGRTGSVILTEKKDDPEEEWTVRKED